MKYSVEPAEHVVRIDKASQENYAIGAPTRLIDECCPHKLAGLLFRRSSQAGNEDGKK